MINEFKYLEGDTVDSEMVVEETRKVTYKDQNISSDLIASTLKEDTVSNADMCVVAMYEEYVEQVTIQPNQHY